MAANVIPLKRVVKKPTNPSDIARPENGAHVEFKPLRCAIDWATSLYGPHVSGRVWKYLAKLGSREGHQTLTLQHAGESLPCTVRLSAGGTQVILLGPGVHLRVLDPDRSRCGEPVSAIYGVEVQIQGTILSDSHNGLDAIRWVKAAVEAALFRHYGANANERAEGLREHVKPGRFDVAVDVAVIGEGAAQWINDELFCGNNIEEANRRISTRAREPGGAGVVIDLDEARARKGAKRRGRAAAPDPTRFRGRESTGRTLYRGRTMAELCIYERSKKRDGDWSILSDTLRACGWDGESEVIRWEVRFSRAWFREQLVSVVRDGERQDIRADKITFDDWLNHATDFARLALTRFRHVVEGKGRVRERESSPYHRAVFAALDLFEGPDRAKKIVATVVSKKRDAAIERAAARACGALVDVMASDPKGEFTMIDAFLIVVGSQWNERAEHWEARYLKFREKWGLDERPVPTWTEADMEDARRVMERLRLTG